MASNFSRAAWAALWVWQGANAGQALAPTEQPDIPKVSAALEQNAHSHAFSGARYQKVPVDLGTFGYVEEEYLVSGSARVFDWMPTGLRVLATGPYTTRILVRRPADARKESGTVIVEPLNPSESVDLPIMWAESYRQFMIEGDAWVGVTIKPNTIKALKDFDPVRYAAVSMANPGPAPRCAARDINAWSQPTTPNDETGLAWDMLSQVGALLKSDSAGNPLGRPAARLYMTGQSQTAGYARLYATVFARRERSGSGTSLYDGFLYSGSPPWQVPVNQCWKDLPDGDPRLITGPAGVPVIELFTQGDMKTNVPTRRADSDVPPDLFRRDEIAGAAHVDPWESLSFASDADMSRLPKRPQQNPKEVCSPGDVPDSDFPVRYVFDAAWDQLEAWVRQGIRPPRAQRLELRESERPLPPDQAFIVDDSGNAKGGVRIPYVDVPTAHWVGAKSGPFICLFYGYKFPFDHQKLRQLYHTHDQYVSAVRKSAAALENQRWLTKVDAQAIVHEAQIAQIP